MRNQDEQDRELARTRDRGAHRSFPLLVVLLTACFRAACPAQTPGNEAPAAKTLTNEIIDRANQLRAIVPVADQFKEQREQVLLTLGELEATARDGQSYLALYRLQSLWTSIQPADYARSRDDVAKQGLPAFEQSWRRL